MFAVPAAAPVTIPEVPTLAVNGALLLHVPPAVASVSAVVERVASAVRELEQAADKVQARAGIVLAQEVRDCVASLRREMLKDMEAASTRRHAKSDALGELLSMTHVRRWIAMALVFAVGIFAAGVWLGDCLR